MQSAEHPMASVVPIRPHRFAQLPIVSGARIDHDCTELADAFDEAAFGMTGLTLLETLVGRSAEIPLVVTMDALRSLVGLACHQTDVTPRMLLQQELDGAPTDQFWRGEIMLDGDASPSCGRD